MPNRQSRLLQITRSAHSKSALARPAVARRFVAMDLLALLIPVTSIVQFEIVGRLYLTDIVIPFLIVLMLPSVKAVWNTDPNVRKVVILAGFWLCAAVASDIINGSSFQSFARGWAKITLFIINLLALCGVLYGNSRRMLIYITSYCLSLIVSSYFFPAMLNWSEYDPWKWIYGMPCTLIALLAAESRFIRDRIGPVLGIILVFSVAFISLSQNFRSLFGITSIVGLIGIYKLVFDPLNLGLKLSWTRFLILVFAGFIISHFFAATINVLALQGILGYDAELKALSTAESSLSLIQSGRVETLVSLRAISDAPFLGHGSWARDIRYVMLLREILELNGVKTFDWMLEDELIPSHSFIFGSWVESGVFGAVFWAFIFILCVVGIKEILSQPHKRTMGPCFLLIVLMWDILFSPFVNQFRFSVPFAIIVACWSVKLKYVNRMR